MARLAVNVDHVATVRQARGIHEPDPVLAAGLAELSGAEGIICHLREDRRHIQDRDLALLRQTVKTNLNLEMAAVEEMIGIALKTCHPCAGKERGTHHRGRTGCCLQEGPLQEDGRSPQA
jgi:pyridoxine 5-phosphate synthase